MQMIFDLKFPINQDTTDFIISAYERRFYPKFTVGVNTLYSVGSQIFYHKIDGYLLLMISNTEWTAGLFVSQAIHELD